MKRFIITIFLALGLGRGAWAGITPEYFNYGIVTNAPVVDAFAFYNTGDFEVETISTFSITNKNNIFGNGYSFLPFQTKDTLYFTNTVSGLLSGEPGFEFDTGTSTSRHSASFFVNQGTIQGIDVEAADYIVGNAGGTEWTAVATDNQPIASQVLVQSSNIINTGSISVGNAGLLSLVGSNVTTAFGSLAAGVLGTAQTNFNFEYDETGIQGEYDFNGAVAGQYFYVPSLGTYDLFWGVTNGFNENVEDVSGELPDVDYFVSGWRNVEEPLLPDIPAADARFTTNVFLFQNGTNVYCNIVFVNTNFANTNMTATVGIAYGGEGEVQFIGDNPDASPYEWEDIVQIAEPVYDVISGQTKTNGIYFVDGGAYLPSYTLSVDGSVAEGVTGEAYAWSRPNAFSLTTATPLEWTEAGVLIEGTTEVPVSATQLAADFAFNDFSFQYLVYYPDTFNAANNTVPFSIATYGAQVGRNPSDLFGSFSSLVDPDSDAYVNLDYLSVTQQDPTNDPGRIEITADNLNVSQARMRAEGMAIFNVTNLVGGGTEAVDFGQANAAINVSSGALVISNIFPTKFTRIRGDIYAVSQTWENTETNDSYGFTTGGPVTNLWHYHVLVVDQNLFGSFPTAERNLTLTGSNSIVVQDNLNVISQATFNTSNLTFASSNYFSQYAQSFLPATTPLLKNLFVSNNAFLGAANILDVGYNQYQGQAAPAGRAYTVNTITNYGQMISSAQLLQSAIFENDGTITANTGGSILIEASNLSMGLVLTNVTNSLVADGSIDLSAISIQARNSVISNGLAEPAALTLTAIAQLTDFVPGTPTTNTNSVIINHWTTTGGFALPVKPVTGDLYGTEIHTIATGVQYITHTWAATDWSNNIARGFTDNEVIGRLVLDRVSNSATLHFSAAGAKNAMYVDYLELTNYAYSDYRSGLAIDPNLTIYFADSNFDPEKLQEIYPNLVWVTNFVGPNSVQVVPYTNSSIVCLMNAAVANSGEIAFWSSIPNYNFLQTYGPYLLNGPYGTNFMDCPGTYTYPCNCTPGTNEYQVVYTNGSPAGGASNLVVLTVSSDGQGSVTPTLTESQLILGHSYTLTATPAAGWVFDSWITALNGNLITSYSNSLTVAFVTNTVITAYFIPIPFPAEAGNYNGLFYQTNGVEPGTSGAVSLTMTKTGKLSGKLTIGSTNYSFSAQFSGSGAAQFKTTSGAQSLMVNLQLDITNQIGQIFGEVSNASWNGNAVLLANLAPTFTSKNPSPLAGTYTMSLPWSAGGDGYGAGTVSKLGALTLAGALADGTTFSETAPVSSGGQWPFYIYSASGKDTVLGWVTVSNGLTASSVIWSKAAGKGPLYPAGFTNQLEMIGSPWQAPSAGSAVLSLPNPAVFLSGGNLTNSLTLSVKSQNSLTFTATNADVSIKSSSGVFTGWFEQPKTTKKIAISGVVLMNTNSALGFFLGTNESGAAKLQSQ